MADSEAPEKEGRKDAQPSRLEGIDAGASYSSVAGVIFIFNYIVGTGVLGMPKATQQAGYIFGVILITAFGFFGYLALSFLIESFAMANAVKNKRNNEIPEIPENIFRITSACEYLYMADMFFSRAGSILTKIAMILYCFGDISIYCVVLPMHLMEIICQKNKVSEDDEHCSFNDHVDMCWNDDPNETTRMNAYRFCVVIFVGCFGPFVYFNVTSTKYLQYFTTCIRWLAFAFIIVLTSIWLGQGKGTGHPYAFPSNFHQISNIFGVVVYAFMCHPAVPQMVTPIRNKDRLYVLFGGTYVLVYMFFMIVTYIAIFALDDLAKMYSLNFAPPKCTYLIPHITDIKFFQYFIAIYPIVTIGSNAPIAAICLRNNLKICIRGDKPMHWIIERFVFPTVVLVIPFCIAMCTNNIQVVVGVTGGFLGVVMQQVLPACFVLCGRNVVAKEVGDIRNPLRNPWGSPVFCYVTLAWACLCEFFTAYSYIDGLVK